MTTEKIGRRIRRNRKSESAESDEITIKRRGPKTRSQSRNRSKERKNSNSHLTDNEEIQTDDLEGFTFTKDSILDKLFIIFLKKRVHFLFGILFGLLILRIFKDTPVNGKWESEYIAQSFGWFKDDKDMSWFDLLGFEISKEQDYPGNSPELEGAVGKYPVVLIPGVVSTNLESWSSSRDKDECLNRCNRVIRVI